MQTITFQPSTSFKVNSEQISTEVDNDIVVLNTNTGKYYSLEGVGSHIWRAINKGEALADIEYSVMSTYHIGSEESQADIRSFISSLHSEGLIDIHA